MKCKSTGIFAKALFFVFLIDKISKLAKGCVCGGEETAPDKKQRVSVLLGGEPFSGNWGSERQADKSPVHSVKSLGGQERQRKKEVMKILTDS